MMSMNPFYTSHRIGQLILKRSALSHLGCLFAVCHSDLFEEVCAYSQVATALVLPLAGNVVELGTLGSRTVRDFLRNIRGAVEVAGKSGGIKRNHLCGSYVIHFLNLCTVSGSDSVTLAS